MTAERFTYRFGSKKDNPNTSVTIKRITFVVPAYNEENTLGNLAGRLNRLSSPNSTEVRLVISDNHSKDSTSAIAKSLIIQGVQADVVGESSIKGFVGSARRVGVEKAISSFHLDHKEASSDEHAIVNFDADTQMVSDKFLLSLVNIFSDPKVMAASSPVWAVSPGIDKHRLTRFLYINQLRNPYLLWLQTWQYVGNLFKQQGRRRKDYLRRPYLFPGAALIMRETAYKQYTSGFHDDDRSGEDVRISLELERSLGVGQIRMPRSLRVYTLARDFLNSKGRISYVKQIKDSLREKQHLTHVPASHNCSADESDRIMTVQSSGPDKIIGSFIEGVDREIYHLKPHEYVEEIIKLRGNKDKKQHAGNLKPAISALTGKVIPNFYAVIKQK